MKKGQRIGLNRRKGGRSGEKYIVFDKSRPDKYVVFVPRKEKGQKNFGRYRTLEQAIACRDKYLSELEQDK